MKRLIPLSLCAVIGCSPGDTSTQQAPPAQRAPDSPAATPSSVTDTTRLRTGATSYTLVPERDAWLASIDYTYSNTGADTVYVVNCNGAVMMSLQQRDGDEWEDVWHPEGNDCLSPPIEIAPNAVHRGRVGIRGGEPDNSSYNRFNVRNLDGEFRLVWNQLVLHYAVGAGRFGDSLPLDARASNAFELKR